MLLGRPQFHENRRSLSLLIDVNEFLPALSTDWRDLLRKTTQIVPLRICVFRIGAVKGVLYLGA
jgi:hypothetical protein